VIQAGIEFLGSRHDEEEFSEDIEDMMRRTGE